MSIVVQCRECGRRYAASDQSAGRQLKCKACGNMIAVPAAHANSASYENQTRVAVAPPMLPVGPQPAYAAPSGGAYTRAPENIDLQRKQRKDRSGVPLLDIILHYMLLVVVVAVPMCLVTALIARVTDTGRPAALVIITVFCILIFTANSLLEIILIGRDSFLWFIWFFIFPITLAVIVVTTDWIDREGIPLRILSFLFPFSRLIYYLTHWDLMWRPVAIHLAGLVALFGSSVILMTAMASEPVRGPRQEQLASADERRQADDSSTEISPNDTNSSSPDFPRRPRRTPEPARPRVSEEQQRLDGIAKQIEAFAARDWRSSSREQALAELATLQATVDVEKKQVDDRVGGASAAWSRVNSEMSTLRSRLSVLPSDAADPSIFLEPTSTATVWTPRRPEVLGDEVTYHTFRIRPPAHALLDLNASENAEQPFIWASASTGATLTLRQTAKTNPKQKQPWAVGHNQAMDRANREQLLAVDTRQYVVSNGIVSGMHFWRVQPKPGNSAPIRYYASAGNDWLTIEILLTDSMPSPTVIDAFDDAVRTIRPQKPGEPKADPFAPERIAKRLSDQPDKALQLLWPHRSAAEALVTPFLSSTSVTTARAAARFLGEFGTKASLAELRTAAEAADSEVANSARTALRRLIPDEFDAAAELLLDLKGKEPSRRAEALTKIVAVKPTPARRAVVATALEDLMLAEAVDVDRALVAQALSAWYGDKTAARLLPLLSKEETEEAKRNAAIDVVAATGDKAGAAIVVRWLLKAPDKTMAALIKMGPVAEEPVYKLYNTISTSRDAAHVAVRANCVRLLSEIGSTFPSQQVLIRASKDPRDPGTQEAAKLGIEAVKGRIAAPKTAPKPATKPV